MVSEIVGTYKISPQTLWVTQFEANQSVGQCRNSSKPYPKIKIAAAKLHVAENVTLNLLFMLDPKAEKKWYLKTPTKVVGIVLTKQVRLMGECVARESRKRTRSRQTDG